VDSVEIQEQTSDGTFGGLCADGYVYNIEVEDNNNYFANGVLVHNCQHCCGSPTRVTQFYKVLSNLSAKYKYGLTATPKRADGLEKSMFALLGPKIHEVPREEVADTTCPVKVSVIPTGWYPDYDCVLMGDGTIDYNKVIDNMIHDDERYKVVFQEIARLNEPTIVLANRVEYLQRLCESARLFGKRVRCLSGMGQSKKAKEERKQALEALNNGELDCIFCTYSLAAEGLDIPNLRYVVFATPEKDPTRIQQASGRVGRKAPDKDCGIVIDFVDAFGMYKSWEKKREAVYKKLGYDII
jgi:superfamily II DNA or RNA helicase